MKRSEIRGNRRRFDHAPGLHFVPSGLRKNERKAKSRKQNADRRNWYSAVASATAAPPDGEAHIYRRSTAVLVPRSLSSQGTKPQARLPGTRRDTFCASFERALPAPACPSPAKAPRAPVWCRRDDAQSRPRARVASPPAGTALARAIRDCLPGRVRHRRGSEFYVTETATYVNVGVTRNHPEIRAAQPRTLKDDGTQSRLLPTLELNYLQNRQASILVGASARTSRGSQRAPIAQASWVPFAANSG